jgi:hypothetical protein
MSGLLTRRIKRLLRKPKFLKTRKKILEFQKFSAICFIGTSQPVTDDPHALAKLFQMLTSLANEYFKKLLTWVLLWSSKFFTFLTGLWPALSPYFGFVIFLSLALLIFRKKVSQTSRDILDWIKKHWPRYGCGVIVFLGIFLLVILVTDIPPLPVMKVVRYCISKISAIFQDSSELSLENPVPITGEAKSSGQGRTLIFLSVISVLFLRYLLNQFHRKVLEDLPFGEILIELYEHDMESRIDSPN